MPASHNQDVPATGDVTSAGIGLVVLLSLIFSAALIATIYFCLTMSGGMSMPGGWTMSMMWMPMAGQTWLGSAVMFMEMWLAMMVAMMLPSSLPMILRFYRGRQSENSRGVLSATCVMIGGYFFVWMAAGAMIYAAGILLALATMRWTGLSRAMPSIFGAVILIAGIMQFMPWTMMGLGECRSASSCGISQANGRERSAWRAGVDSGISCLTCCCGPTLILLALGMMNPVVILLVSAMIAVEKLMPRAERIVHVSGVLAILAGAILIGRIVY